jgi:hypothetical protein
MLAEEFVGYESLISFLEERALPNLEGDIIEIGAYKGGGTVKLARFAKRYGKKVYAVDTFDPGLDQTVGKGEVKACEVYDAFLYGRSMLEVYRETTRDFDNIVTIGKDSKKITFPDSQKFFFGLVDGCHQMSYVENDFGVIWPHLVSGGMIGFHDYGFDDWPEVTTAVDGLIEVHKREIREIHAITGKYNILCMMLVKA